MDVTQRILHGHPGGLDPALYQPGQIAGYGSSVWDHKREPRQPAGWHAGCAPPWSRVWLPPRG